MSDVDRNLTSFLLRPRTLPSTRRPVQKGRLLHLPQEVLVRIITEVGKGRKIVLGSACELKDHREARTRLFALASTSVRLRKPAIRALTDTILLASSREWIFWLGKSWTGLSGVLRKGLACWDVSSDSGALPVKVIWLSVDGNAFPRTTYPHPNLDTVYHTIAPHVCMELFGFERSATSDLTPVRVADESFALHILPRLHDPTDDTIRNITQATPEASLPQAPLRPEPLKSTLESAIHLHALPTTPACDTPFLSRDSVTNAFAFVAAYNCLLKTYRPEGVRSSALYWPVASPTHPDVQAANNELLLTRRRLRNEGLLFWDNRPSSRFSADVQFPILPYARGVMEQLDELHALLELGAGHPDSSRDTPDGEPWLFTRGDQMEPLDRVLSTFGRREIPEGSGFTPRSMGLVLENVIIYDLDLRMRILDQILLLSPHLREITLPYNANVADVAFLDYCGTRPGGLTGLSLSLRYLDKRGRVCTAPRS